MHVLDDGLEGGHGALVGRDDGTERRVGAVEETGPRQTEDGHRLQALMARLELLISRVEQLKSQNGLLLAQEKSWREERAHLIEKNEIARRKVESMISRLKALEQDS